MSGREIHTDPNIVVQWDVDGQSLQHACMSALLHCDCNPGHRRGSNVTRGRRWRPPVPA